MAERRKFMRFDAELRAFYEVTKDGSRGKSIIKDLSREGAGFLLDKQLAKGTEVYFRVDVPGENRPIFARAGVIWSRKSNEKNQGLSYLTGLRFTKIENYDKSRLLEHVYSKWIRQKQQSRFHYQTTVINGAENERRTK